MTKDELIAKGMNCLIEHLGYIEAGEFLNYVSNGGNEYSDYTEWRRENLFENMSEGEFLEGAIKYAKSHHLE